MAKSLVTVLMSVYNGAKFLPEAIESILEQTFSDFEFIIINDGSTDQSGNILAKYQQKDPRIHIYKQDNHGLVYSLNKGCDLARGKYIARMDADDIAVKKRLEWQVEFLEKNKDVGLIGGAVDVVDVSGKFIRVSSNPLTDADIRAALEKFCPFWHPTVIMEKAIVHRVGGYRKAVFGAEDYDLWLRMAEHCQLANLDKVILKYRLHPNQVTVSKVEQLAYATLAVQASAKVRQQGRNDGIDAQSEITPSLLTNLGVDEVARQAALANRFLWSIVTMYNNGDYIQAKQLLNQLFQTCDWQHSEAWVVADIHLICAKLDWYEQNYIQAFRRYIEALQKRPALLARPFRDISKIIQNWLCKLNLASPQAQVMEDKKL